ncbi:type VI secretion system protein TssA [Enterobacter asburiae]|uniref:type VI secretion system protein TssA n=1 Tax=Enterobacter asburiae TaxID=61645 RepID=UPI00192ACE9C|nr:type VI secretion system protein TssA [Enterobacter asburiae]MBL5837766.1 type VI secretion system protein TssA [Enterobacter asburiae]MBL5939756.1 type VI secretion system protein TssA [Enterobacter asburiae]MBL5962846.1 type VI secretion system protein TssA [Enterobacter asburiae]MBL5969080.1 type VI secretion system protein TssA [Enterobacter asburiae]
MSSPEDLLTACATSQEERLRLISRANDALSLWDNWLYPFTSGSETGDDPAYDDDFQLMREEINKISGTDSALLCELAQKCLCEYAKDIRVVTWYVQARLCRDGEKGLSEGLLLLVAMLTRYGQACHPQRPAARKAALEWLNSAKVIDALLLWPEVDSNDAGLTAGAINLLETAVAEWTEAEKPSFAGLCTALENRLARSGGMEALVPQNSSAQEQRREPSYSDSPQLLAVKSGRDLLDQAKLLSCWLSEQPQGWLASHRLIKTVRWDTVDQNPPLDSSGRTRLVPPKPEYRVQLKRLYLQKNWTELVEQASQMYCEGVNHFWLDLQWYLWQGLSHAGQPWDTWSDSVLFDLRLLLKRLPGLEGLAWNDGTPFADEVTTAWIAEKVNEEGLMFGDELATTVVNGQADDVLLLESEAMEKGDTEGPEAALAWLQSRPGMDTLRHRWLIRLLMARVAEQYGRNEMALHLLGELTSCAPQLTLGDWEPGLLFEVRARRLKLLRMKAGRSESDKARLMPEMESLLAGLIAIDPARAMVLCG